MFYNQKQKPNVYSITFEEILRVTGRLFHGFVDPERGGCMSMKIYARRKQYVEVVATHYIDGSVRPQKIVLATGPVYEIEDSREAAPGKAHTTGELARRYVVKIKGKETYLYETGGRWFVEMKA